jgi:pimeloyl-ACP methyl ester carboxylesterase
MALFDIDAGALFYEDHGSGDPPLVFVHGLACAHEDWRHQLGYFSPSHRVVSLDLRGHGRSAGCSSGFDIVSFGADVARRATLNSIQASGYEAFFERLFTQMFTAASDAQIRDATLARAGRLARNVGLELVPQMAAWDAGVAERALRSAKVPVTVLQSTYLDENRERVSLQAGESSAWLELVKERVPQAEIHIIPGVGHFTMIEAADEVNRHIEAMLAGLNDR